MQLGLPNVTSTVGAEAMHGDLNWNGCITNSDEEFIEKAIELYSNEELWNTAQKNGIDLVNQRFEKSLFETDFVTKIGDLLSNLETHRNQNFLGQILQHQTMQSTKFMSRWIELKNRNC